MTRGFTIAVPEPVAADPIEFYVDGTEEALYAYPPGGGQLAVMMAGISGDDDAEGIAGMINGIFSMFDEETRTILRKRLLTPDHIDPFGMPQIMQILSSLMEESSDRPTESSSASAPSRTTTATRSPGGARRQAPADPYALPARRFLNLVYWYFAHRVEDREKFDQMLEAPIPGESPSARTTVDTRRETSNLMAVAGWAAAVQRGDAGG